MPLGEIALRATVVYFVLIVVLRAIPRRNADHISPNDMPILIVIGSKGTDAIMGGSTSIGGVSLMIALIAGWAILRPLEYRIPALRGVLRDRQATLIDRVRFLRGNMRRELITEEELLAVLRKESVNDVSSVRSAFLEADSEISVIVADGRRER